MSLRSSMEEVFTNTEARVVAAYKVDCIDEALTLEAGTSFGASCCTLLIALQVVKCLPSATSTFSSKKKPPKVECWRSLQADLS